MAGAFDHDLHVVLPGLAGELAEGLELCELRLVGGVGYGAGTETVAQRVTDVVFRHELGDAVEVLVEKVLLVVRGHPLRENRPTTADDAGDALRHHRDILHQHARVDGEVVDALQRLLLDNFEVEIDVQVFNALHPRERLVDRHSADRHRRVANDGVANHRYVAASGKIHDRVSTEVNSRMQLAQLLIHIRRKCRVTNVRVDLA